MMNTSPKRGTQMLKFAACFFLAVGSAVPAVAFERAQVLASCSEPTSEVCIRAVFEAATLEIREMGGASELDDVTGLPPILRDQIDRMIRWARDLDDPDRQSLLESFTRCREAYDVVLANTLMQFAGGAAHDAIGGESFDGFPEVGNAMVPDILELWDRLLDWLSTRKTPPPIDRMPILYSEEGLELPLLIAAYQAELGFNDDARATRERYYARADEVAKFFKPLEGVEPPASLEQARRALDLSAGVEAGRPDAIETSLKEVPRNAEAAAGWLSQVIRDTPDGVSPELLSAFLSDRGDDLDGTDRSRILSSLVDVGRIAEAKALAATLEDPSDYWFALHSLILAAPDSVSSEEVLAFGRAHGEALKDRIFFPSVVGALVHVGGTDEALMLVEAFQGGVLATNSLATILEIEPVKVSPEYLKDFLAAQGDNLEGPQIAWLVNALAHAKRFDEATAVLNMIGEDDSAGQAISDLIEQAPEALPPEALSVLLSDHEDHLDGGDRVQIVRALASLGRFSEAHVVFDRIEEPDAAIAALSTLIELDPAGVSPGDLKAYLALKGDSLAFSASKDESWWTDPRIGLVEALASVNRLEEARRLAESIDNASAAADALEAIVKTAPGAITADDLSGFLETHGEALVVLDIVYLAGAFAEASDLENASTLLGRLREVASRQPLDEAGRGVCESPVSELKLSSTLVVRLFPQVLAEVENEVWPCARLNALSNIGSALIGGRRGK